VAAPHASVPTNDRHRPTVGRDVIQVTEIGIQTSIPGLIVRGFIANRGMEEVMQAKIEGHSVIVFPDLTGGWYFVEVDGDAIYRFGPFDSYEIVSDLLPVLFPEVPTLKILEPVELDDNALMILGNGERVGETTREHPIA